ncbi:hypothetical protein CFP56_035440 [Quercus suber]|uniref:Uncharacterized protein n=1 Tax=Quercus suber TaxID=58331 RepID=A0AAW0J9Z1_QUESU
MTKDNKLSPMQAGSFPENELSLRFKNDNIAQFRNDPDPTFQAQTVNPKSLELPHRNRCQQTQNS